MIEMYHCIMESVICRGDVALEVFEILAEAGMDKHLVTTDEIEGYRKKIDAADDAAYQNGYSDGEDESDAHDRVRELEEEVEDLKGQIEQLTKEVKS